MGEKTIPPSSNNPDPYPPSTAAEHLKPTQHCLFDCKAFVSFHFIAYCIIDSHLYTKNVIDLMTGPTTLTEVALMAHHPFCELIKDQSAN